MTAEPPAFIGTSDLAGLVRGKSVPLAELPGRMGRGVGIAPSSLLLSAFGPILDTPFGTAGDLALVPDPATRTAVPMPDGRDRSLDYKIGGLTSLGSAIWSPQTGFQSAG